MATVQVRYIVNDVDAAIAFYCQHLGFKEVMHPAPAFAMLTRGDLRLVLSAPNPSAGGGQPMLDGRKQEPGGWNRFAIEVSDLAGTVENLRKAGIRFRNEIVIGVGGKQILVDDPSGNPIELFEPTRPEARLKSPHWPATLKEAIMTNITGPDFITLLVSDLEASYRFYKEMIGLPESTERQPNAHAFATKPCGLAIRQSSDRQKTEHPGQGIIVWLKSSDASALHDELKRRGIPIFENLRQTPFGMTFSFQDPDGYILTVHDGG